MSDFLPASERLMADLQRRVLALETTQRVGINRSVAVWGTASALPTTFGAWETGATGCTWASTTGATGTGYGQVTVEINTFALVVFAGLVRDIADDPSAATYRSNRAEIGLSVDGTIPTLVPAPQLYRSFFNFNAGPLAAPFTFAAVRQFSKGAHTLQVQAMWENNYPAAPFKPQLTDVVVTVVPLD